MQGICADVWIGGWAPTSLLGGARRAPRWRGCGREVHDLDYGSQQDYDALAGKPAPGQPGWSAADFAALGSFMVRFNTELAESGELVETRACPPRCMPAGSGSAAVRRW